MNSLHTTRWLKSGYVGLSAVVTAASLRSALQFASTPEANLGSWWWLPSMELVRDPSPVGWTIFVIAALALWRAVKSRSHGGVAASTAGTAVAVYLVLLDRWSTLPGPFIDPRIIYTMMFSLIPLYVSILALAAHTAIAGLNSRAEK